MSDPQHDPRDPSAFGTGGATQTADRLSDADIEAFASRLRPSWERQPSEEAPIPLTRRSSPPPGAEATKAATGPAQVNEATSPFATGQAAAPVTPAPGPRAPSPVTPAAAPAAAATRTDAGREPTDVVPRRTFVEEDTFRPSNKASSRALTWLGAGALLTAGIAAWWLLASPAPGDTAPGNTAQQGAAPGDATGAPEVVPSAAAPREANAPAAAAPSAPGVTTSTPPAPASATAAPPAPRAPPTEYLLSVRATPDAARVRIDGKLHNNPFTGPLPAGKSYRVEASLAGHTTEGVTVVLDRERRVLLELRSAKPAPKPSARTPRRESKAPKKRAPTKATKPKPAGGAFVSDNPY